MRYLTTFVIIALAWPLTVLLTEPAKIAIPAVVTAYWTDQDQRAVREGAALLVQSWTPLAMAGPPPESLTFPAPLVMAGPCTSDANPCDNGVTTAVTYVAVTKWFADSPDISVGERDVQVRISAKSSKTLPGQASPKVFGNASTVVTIKWLPGIGVRVIDLMTD